MVWLQTEYKQESAIFAHLLWLCSGLGRGGHFLGSAWPLQCDVGCLWGVKLLQSSCWSLLRKHGLLWGGRSFLQGCGYRSLLREARHVLGK